MSTGDSEHGHIIEVCGDEPAMEISQVGSKVCTEAPCGFSDARNTSKDAREMSTSMKKFLIAVVLCIIFMCVEVVGGIEANSLAILTDAAHLLSDVAAFAISLFSLWASGWEATPRQSYGFFRIEILGALVSIQIIWLLAGILVYEAIERLINGTTEVHGFLMFIIAAFGLLVNIAMALLLGHDHSHGHGHSHGHDDAHEHDTHAHSHEDRGDLHTDGLTVKKHDHHHHGEDSKGHADQHHDHETGQTEPLLQTCSEAEGNSKLGTKQKQQRNVNIQGAYLHVLGDSIQSMGVMIGGAIIWIKPEWKIVDLICTLIFLVIVLGTTIRMLRNILEVLMESTPREIDATRLESGLREMDEVIAVHELHIWAITVGKVLLAYHVKIKRDANADMVLDKVVDYIKREHKISHITIQVERE
ncbi:metal tolerance protein 1 [Eucalyptus grandis]|uniref:metal tolerance protein 1 n=1 Tax=Eucalyptus grandis TaxID=71139 RepID=UPI00192E8D36|nr:metal tolerance protein 1 [Eucalyptus grandis]